jgi:cell division protease FtsH
MQNFGKNIFIWLIILLVASFVVGELNDGQKEKEFPPRGYSFILDQIKNGKVESVEIEGSEIKGYSLKGRLKDGQGFSASAIGGESLISALSASGTQFNYVKEEDVSNLWLTILSWLPIILIGGVWFYFMRQMQGGGKGGTGGGGGGPFSFGKIKSKALTEDQKKVTFNDVAGAEEAKEEVTEIVDFLKDPAKFQKLGAKIPRGVLLVGPPGTGKTLLARAVAGEAGVPFFSISGSDFVEMFVGVGASRVRDMFEQGKRNAPCIIFIDEIDAVGRKRSSGAGGSHEEREQTLNQLLVEMDGFDTNEGVIIIAATNRADVLDPALLRPGRFDRQITVPLPDIGGREKILRVHLKKIPLAPDVDAKIIARGTPGFSGAELANIANEAALLAARRNKKIITMRELEEAKDKVMMGAERRSLVMSEAEKKLTAYHEAGHAIVGIHCPASDPIHKATIIPRGRALGLVMRLPESDRLSMSREKLEADLAVAYGGRVAEEMIFGKDKVTTGASSDIQMATNIAESMVLRWGLSDKVGPIDYSADGDQYIAKDKMSVETKKLIDEEIKRIINDGYTRAKKILTKHRDELEMLGAALLDYETLSGDEIKDLLAGKLRKDKPIYGKTKDSKETTRRSVVPSAGAKKPRKKASKNTKPTDEKKKK